MNYCQGLSEYRINYGTLIGQGQYGKVYACEKIGLIGLSLCAKISIVEEQDKAIIDKEVEVLKQIQNIENPNIIHIEKIIYERNSEGKLQMIVIMEKCHTNLKEEMKKTFNEYEIQDFLQQILKGYKGLNEKHIVHRDIKPENILINKLGEKNYYKIADFGTSKVLQENQNVLQTQIGTPLYAAPEMNRLHSDAIKNVLQNDILKCQYNSQPDIFSLGIILSQLVFGESCFKAYENCYKIIELHILFRDKQFIFPNKQMINPYILKAIPEMLEFLPSKRLTIEKISEYFKLNECSQTFRKFNVGTMQTPFQQQPKNFQNGQAPQFIQQFGQNQFQPNNGQNKFTIQQQANKFPLPQQNFNNFQKQPQFSPQIFSPQKNVLVQQSPLKQSLIEDQQKYFQPIIQYLEIQKIQAFQLFSQIITQKLERAMTYLKKEYTISPQILKDYIKILQECYPYNCKDNTDFYIRFQFSLFRLSNPGLSQEDPSSIEEMKQIMDKHKQLP